MALSAQIFNLNKSGIPQLSSSLVENGLRLEDEISIYPFKSQVRRLSLNRTKYEFHSSDVFRKGQYGAQLYLPTLPSEIGNVITFQLINVRTKGCAEIQSIYEAFSETPFRLNGQWTSRAPLKRGDIIDLGLIRFCLGQNTRKANSFSSGVSEAMAQSTLPILIEGETGTGKTTLARDIHNQSQVVGRFIHLNLSAFSPSLVESELFGHVKGAFTGAHRDKTGALAMAHNGTLFLDEVDSLSKELQTKLLLFLDSGVVRIVGGATERKVQTRLIFASGSRLSQKVKQGEMRADFYHRLCSGVKIELPSLREDKEMLANIISNFALKHERAICPSLVQHYERYSWPGNIRELNGHLYKKHILNPNGVLRFDEHDQQLLLGSISTTESKEEYQTLRERKTNYINYVLARVDYSITDAAKILGIAENTVRKFI